MDAFAKMDIFFLVTTIVVVVLAIFVAVLLFYVLRTAKDISAVTHIVRKESERFAKGASLARKKFKRNRANTLQKIIAFVQSLSVRKK